MCDGGRISSRVDDALSCDSALREVVGPIFHGHISPHFRVAGFFRGPFYPANQVPTIMRFRWKRVKEKSNMCYMSEKCEFCGDSGIASSIDMANPPPPDEDGFIPWEKTFCFCEAGTRKRSELNQSNPQDEKN